MITRKKRDVTAARRTTVGCSLRQQTSKRAAMDGRREDCRSHDAHPRCSVFAPAVRACSDAVGDSPPLRAAKTAQITAPASVCQSIAALDGAQSPARRRSGLPFSKLLPVNKTG